MSDWSDRSLIPILSLFYFLGLILKHRLVFLICQYPARAALEYFPFSFFSCLLVSFPSFELPDCNIFLPPFFPPIFFSLLPILYFSRNPAATDRKPSQNMMPRFNGSVFISFLCCCCSLYCFFSHSLFIQFSSLLRFSVRLRLPSISTFTVSRSVAGCTGMSRLSPLPLLPEHSRISSL